MKKQRQVSNDTQYANNDHIINLIYNGQKIMKNSKKKIFFVYIQNWIIKNNSKYRKLMPNVKLYWNYSVSVCLNPKQKKFFFYFVIFQNSKTLARNLAI